MHCAGKIAAAAIIAASAGCSTIVTHQAPTSVKEATAAQTKDCELLQTISATSPFYGLFAGAAMQDLRDKVIATAAQISATHVVLGQNETTYGSTSMHAQAFKCAK